MRMIKKILIVLTVFMGLSMSLGTANAEEIGAASQGKPLSMSTVWTLSALPINSPALFYAKRPISGVITSIFEAGGLALGTYGAIVLAQINDCSAADNFAGLCTLGSAVSKSVATGLLIGGYGALWLPPYIYGLVAAPRAAKKYNDSLAAVSFKPTFFILPGGGGIGLAGKF